MAQFHCEICGQGFNQKSAYERHRLSSHPLPEPSVVDFESLFKGIDLPCDKDGLLKYAYASANQKQRDLLLQLPEQTYRDSAEIARAIGEVKSHKPGSTHQPSKTGGQNAMKSLSAARIAEIFSGVKFPATSGELYDYAKDDAEEDARQLISRFANRTYRDMSDVEREVGRLTH